MIITTTVHTYMRINVRRTCICESIEMYKKKLDWGCYDHDQRSRTITWPPHHAPREYRRASRGTWVYNILYYYYILKMNHN